MTRLKLPPGRLFSVPYGDGRYALGQVVQEKPITFVAIWGKEFHHVPAPEELDDAGVVLLAGYVDDTGFASKRWRLIGNAQVVASIPRPCYVVDGPSGQVLKRFDESVVRAADKTDLDFYGRKTIANAAVFEGALNHFLLNGANDWDYEKYLASRAAARVC